MEDTLGGCVLGAVESIPRAAKQGSRHGQGSRSSSRRARHPPTDVWGKKSARHRLSSTRVWNSHARAASTNIALAVPISKSAAAAENIAIRSARAGDGRRQSCRSTASPWSSSNWKTPRSKLLEPLGEGSPIAAFLEKNSSGGMHHICYEVDDIMAVRDGLVAGGARVLGDGTPKIGAHGKPVLFLHLKDFFGTLIELEQV